MALEINKMIESLSPLERKVIPYLNEDIEGIIEKSSLDRVSVLRALEFLNSKRIISLKIEKRRIVDLGTNGIYYKKKGLPERNLLGVVEKKILSIEEAQIESKLSDNEFKAALGALKKRALIELKNGKIHFSGSKEEVGKKTIEERFLDELPLGFSDLTSEQRFAFDKLRDRKEIVELRDEPQISFVIEKLGKDLINADLSKAGELLEEITPDMLKGNGWKGKKFRLYDVTSPVPRIFGGKRHFVAQATDYGRMVWAEMGFEEMTGDLLQSSFWNFDALFTAQDHPVREMQDTFFLDKKSELPEKKLVNGIRKAHEGGLDESKGWRYSWSEEEAKRMVMRTHTTPLSVQILAGLDAKKLPRKFFALGKCFRNETIDWSHGFEFYQSEGIVVDKDANFRHLLGYLKEFYKKMGFEKIRFQPAYFAYTEPSVEVHVYHPEKKKWLEFGGAGIFRPEVVIPLLGEWVPVLAWGQGFDRILMDYYGIKDLRELYTNDIKQLREMRVWKK